MIYFWNDGVETLVVYEISGHISCDGLIQNQLRGLYIVIVRIQPFCFGIIDKLREAWEYYNPGFPFEYQSLTQDLEDLYIKEQRKEIDVLRQSLGESEKRNSEYKNRDANTEKVLELGLE